MVGGSVDKIKCINWINFFFKVGYYLVNLGVFFCGRVFWVLIDVWEWF